jgi:hypothetical protein
LSHDPSYHACSFLFPVEDAFGQIGPGSCFFFFFSDMGLSAEKLLWLMGLSRPTNPTDGHCFCTHGAQGRPLISLMVESLAIPSNRSKTQRHQSIKLQK